MKRMVNTDNSTTLLYLEQSKIMMQYKLKHTYFVWPLLPHIMILAQMVHVHPLSPHKYLRHTDTEYLHSIASSSGLFTCVGVEKRPGIHCNTHA